MSKEKKSAEHILPSSKPMKKADLVKLAKEAEKGPFYTSDEVKEKVKEWKKKHA